MTTHDFTLALEKPEVVILTRRSIGELTIESKSAVKYLGLMLDSKMSFFEQIKATANRALAEVAALNVGDPMLVLLYGTEVWADALDKEVHRKRLAQVQRWGALQVASAYRTISEPAVMVIAGVILVAKERKATYCRKGENLKQVVAREKTTTPLTEW